MRVVLRVEEHHSAQCKQESQSHNLHDNGKYSKGDSPPCIVAIHDVHYHTQLDRIRVAVGFGLDMECGGEYPGGRLHCNLILACCGGSERTLYRVSHSHVECRICCPDGLDTQRSPVHLDYALDSVRVDGSNSCHHLTPEKLQLSTMYFCREATGVRQGQCPCLGGKPSKQSLCHSASE